MAKKITVNMVLTAEDSVDEGITFNVAEEFIEAIKHGWLKSYFPGLNVDIKAAKVTEV